MTQYETLFDTGETAWRLELRVKSGGGPFDPAGYSIHLVNPTGALVAQLVHKAESSERPHRQMADLLAEACTELARLTAEFHRDEASASRRR